MRVTAKSDYAVRAAIELAAAGDQPLDAEAIAAAQEIPLTFLVRILAEMRDLGILAGEGAEDRRYRLARPASEVTVAEVVDAIDGPLASVHSESPGEMTYPGSAKPLRDVWLALQANVNAVLGAVTLADIAAGSLPPQVTELRA